MGATADVKEILKNIKPKLAIDGEFVDAQSGKVYPLIDPRTEEVIIQVAEGDTADIDRAVAAARRAFDEGPWPKMSPSERGRALYKLADSIEKHSEEFALLETLDTGKPLSVARTVDVPSAVQYLRYYAGWADKFEGKTLRMDANHFGYTLREPIGVVGQILPWNFPLAMLIFKLAPALVCGCTVVVKCSEETPLTALRAAELAFEIGLPAGVVNIIPGYGPTAGAALVSHPGVDKISFTGSTCVGQEIMKKSSVTMKEVSLELGGKSPFIVCPDADLEVAAQTAHQALFFNQGQVCIAASRTFVHEDIYDEFVAKLVELAQARVVGDPFTAVEQGPQINEKQFLRVLGYIESGKQEGAQLLCGGQKAADRGYYIEPTVFGDVTDEMKIAKEEIFGPVQSILKFKTTEEVIRRANASAYGLSASAWTKNIDLANQFSRGLRAGTVWINCHLIGGPMCPHGGYNMSGIGRELGEESLRNFTQVKSVITPLKDPAWI